MSGFSFRPAQSFTDRHGLFVALAGGTNSGKSFSALRVARGIAGPKGKIAALDTEGGRLLHLKQHFDFDAHLLDPPHRPDKYADAAKSAEDAGYDVLLIDSFSMEWVGLGGVLDWQAEEFQRMGSREQVKLASWIKPKVAHKAMVYSFLQRRMPIVFSMRAEEKAKKVGNEVKSEWAPVCNKAFPFEVTVSFMLMQDRQGVIDLSRPHKMEGSHREIFRDGDQLSEEHGAKLAAWARGELGAPPPTSRQPADPMEFWSRETLAIPVRMKADESGTDWPAWQARMVKAALSAPDQAALLRLTSDNGSSLGNLQRAEPDLYAEMQQAVADSTERFNAAVGDLLPADAQ